MKKTTQPTKIPAGEQKRLREAVELAADRWDAYFETFIGVLLDPQVEPDRARLRIQLAA